MNNTVADPSHCPFESGSLILMPNFLDNNQSDLLLKELTWQDHWNKGQYTVAGRQFSMPRLQSWYSDPGIVYNFSYELHKHRLWTPSLVFLKGKIEKTSKAKFNSVLINWYRNGNDWVDWHSDNEVELGPAPLISSLSLGATRKFGYVNKQSNEMGFVELMNGDLLIMKSSFQKFWKHCIPQDKDIKISRVNLTFRSVIMPKEPLRNPSFLSK